MSEELWVPKWEDVGIVRLMKTKPTLNKDIDEPMLITLPTTKDALTFKGNSVYMHWVGNQLKAAFQKYHIDEKDLPKSCVLQYLRDLGNNNMELVFFFSFPSNPMRRMIPK